MLVKTFTATHSRDRAILGEAVTSWIRSNPQARVVQHAVRQSSDNKAHCITITLVCEEVCP